MIPRPSLDLYPFAGYVFAWRRGGSVPGEGVDMAGEGDKGEKRKRRQGATILDAERETHPSFGLITISRVTGGGGELFGSSMPHTTRVRIGVRRAERARDLHRDWRHATEEVLELEMSPAQFADFIISMGNGEGTPCTLRYVLGERMPDCPPAVEPREQIVKEFREKMRASSAAFNEAAGKLDAILAKKSLNNADRQEVRAIVGDARRLFYDHLAFAGTSFAEANEDALREAQAEAEAFVADLVRRAGVAHLASGPGPRGLGAGASRDRKSVV